MLDIHDRARLLQVAIERSLAAEGLRQTTTFDLAAVLVETLLSSDRVALFRSYMEQRYQHRLKFAVRNAIAQEMLANRLSRFNDCLSIFLAELASDCPNLLRRFASSDEPQLQRIAQLVAGEFIISDRVELVQQTSVEPVQRVKPKRVKKKTEPSPANPETIEDSIMVQLDDLKKRRPRQKRYRTSYEITSTLFVRRSIRELRRKVIDEGWLDCEFRTWPLPRLTLAQKQFTKRATDYVKAHMGAERSCNGRISLAQLDIEAERLWKRIDFRARKAKSARWIAQCRQREEISPYQLRMLACGMRVRTGGRRDASR